VGRGAAVYRVRYCGRGTESMGWVSAYGGVFLSTGKGCGPWAEKIVIFGSQNAYFGEHTKQDNFN